jgi:Sulfate permease family
MILAQRRNRTAWLRYVPQARWLVEYRLAWLPGDFVAGATVAAYAIPVSLAYAGLAGLSPQVGVYGYLLGGLGYALIGSSRQLAIGPTSAISLMIAGTVGAMSNGDAQRYAQIASLTGLTVAMLCVTAWALRLSDLVKLISDSILVGFKAGAGLTIAMTQLPSLLGAPGGGHNFYERLVLLAGQLDQTRYLVLAIGGAAFVMLMLGDRKLRGNRSRSPSSCCRSSPRPRSDFPLSEYRQQDTSRPAYPNSALQRYGWVMSRVSFHSPPGACCSPISKASPQGGPLRQSTDTRSTCGRSCSASERQTSLPRSGTDIRWRADCHNRP